MKLSFLLTLQAVLRKGSFAAAAAEIGLTPSAVSQQMQQLETYFGQPLFDRSLRVVRPTPFAREVVSTMDGALASLEALRTRNAPLITGQLRLGVINSVQVSVLPRCLLLLRDKYPQLKTQLAVDTSQHLLSGLKSGELDAAVVVRPATGGSRKLHWRNLHKDPFVLLAPPDIEDDAPRRIVLLPWIRYNSQSSGGQLAASFVRKLAPASRPAFDMQSTDAIVAMVSAGLGFSVLPRPRLPLLQAYPVKEIRLDRQMPHRQIAHACRTADRDSRRLEAIASGFAQVYASTV